MARLSDRRGEIADGQLLALDRHGFALEFLRRNPEYRKDFRNILKKIRAGHADLEAALMRFSRRWGLRFSS
jgi:hypothetical protein